MKRLFFALWPDDAVREHIAQVASLLPAAQGSRIPQENLHLTLSFIGAADADYQARLVQQAGQVVAPMVNIALTRLAYFKQPRVIYLGCDHCAEPLTALVNELNAHLQLAGYQPEQRPYHPHVTLKRNAQPVPQDLSVSEIIWSVKDFVLVESSSKGDGVRYDVLERFALYPAS